LQILDFRLSQTEPLPKPVSIDCLLVADDLTGACDAGVSFAATVLLESGAVSGAQAPAARVFKKIDSTLRGNTGLEIALALESFQCDAAVVCPSFPAMQRVVQDGFLKVTSAPEFAPIDVSARLAQQSGLPCAHTAPDGVTALLASGVRLVSVDANCDRDLDRIAAAVLPMGRRILWAGSAGLASALARRLGTDCAPHSAPTRPGAVLFCIGSDHPVTLAQQTTLLAGRACLLADAADSIAHALSQGRHVVLRIPRGRISAEAVRERIAGAPAAALVLSGGDTASLVCRAARVQSIELCGEIVAGVPHGILRGGAFDGVPVVTKSGGFGRSDTLIQVADYFTCLNQSLP
jgi:uncharacterized protein YgbK (DUF1537 family)